MNSNSQILTSWLSTFMSIYEHITFILVFSPRYQQSKKKQANWKNMEWKWLNQRKFAHQMPTLSKLLLTAEELFIMWVKKKEVVERAGGKTTSCGSWVIYLCLFPFFWRYKQHNHLHLDHHMSEATTVSFEHVGSTGALPCSLRPNLRGYLGTKMFKLNSKSNRFV